MEINDKKQIKALDWINDLMQYAEAQKLPMRVLDELEDCKKQLSSEVVDWNNIDAAVTEILDSIEEKTGSTMVKSDSKKQEVSVEQVEAQVKKVAQRCHTENIDSVNSTAERKNIVIKKNYDQLRDITRAKAHLEEFKNEDLYLQFFQNCKTSYENDVFGMFGDMIQSISSNYVHMLDHMKSMFQSIGGYKIGISNEKFYYEYEERRIEIDKKILSEASTADTGGNDIISFGQKTKDAISSIVKKLERKRKILAWVPLIILLCIFIFGSVLTQRQSRDTIESVATATDSDDSFIKDIAKDIGVKVIEKASLKAVGTVLSSVVTLLLSLLITFGAVIILFLLIIIVCYMVYLKMLKTWCNNKICRECSKHLTEELIQFEHNNVLSVKLDAAMQSAADEYEQQYMDILNNLFIGTPYEADNGQQKESSKVAVMREEWNKIKYE